MERLLTLQEMAEHLSVSSRTLMSHVVRLDIPHFTIGGRPRFDRNTVLSYFQSEQSKVIVKPHRPAPKERKGPFVGILG